jgi:tetratricopeptide (TPR) repeat protein
MWQRTTISADHGSIAAGRDAIVGVRDEVLESLVRDRTKLLQDLAETQKSALILLQDKLQLNERQILSALNAAGEAEVPPEDIGKRLIEIAEHYKVLKEEVRPAPGDDPRVAELKAHAAKAIEDGALEQADAFLADLAQVQEALLARAALDVAATHARRGEVALARLRYREAADHFAAASKRVPPAHEEQRLACLNSEANALYRQGDEFGDNGVLVAAIERYRALLALYPREHVPLDWAMTKLNLGKVLAILGERTEQLHLLKEAREATAAAREVYRHAGTAQCEADFADQIEPLDAAIAALERR